MQAALFMHLGAIWDFSLCKLITWTKSLLWQHLHIILAIGAFGGSGASLIRAT